MPILQNRQIAHLDLDAFFVSVERLRQPKLNGKPVMIGGGERGVVMACSYETRQFGVHSAMPMKQARRLCPQAIVLHGDYEAYSQHSRLVTEVIAHNAPSFEKASIDEFYLDLTGMDKYHGCLRFTSELKDKVKKEVGLPISYALASNKLISKVATNEVKPNGQIEVPNGQEKRYLAPLSIMKIPGVGLKTGYRLLNMGVETVKTLSEVPLDLMRDAFGLFGADLSRKANGIDEAPVVPFHEQKSISAENTFHQDTIDTVFLQSKIVRLMEEIAFALRQQNKLAGCVAVKLRYSDFATYSKQQTITYTNSDSALITVAKELFRKLYDRRLLVRLVGVRLTDLIPGNRQIDLFGDTQENVKLLQAIDSVKSQFGEGKLLRGGGMISLKDRGR